MSLHDACPVVLGVFGSVNARSGLLDEAIRLLLAAADSGKRADIATATDRLERVVRDRRLVSRPRVASGAVHYSGLTVSVTST
jgi:hypothetical protein